MMTHDDDMWQDYDYHQNTGELPEYFDDEDDAGYDGGDDDYGCDVGPDYYPIHARCPRCGCMSAALLVDGNYSCLYCGTVFYNDRIIHDSSPPRR